MILGAILIAFWGHVGDVFLLFFDVCFEMRSGSQNDASVNPNGRFLGSPGRGRGGVKTVLSSRNQ